MEFFRYHFKSLFLLLSFYWNKKSKKMARTSTQKIKIGVHWKNSVSIGISSSNSPRHPKLIELDPVCILLLYFNLTRTFIGHCTRCLYFTNMRWVRSMRCFVRLSSSLFFLVGKFLNQIEFILLFDMMILINLLLNK